MAYQLITRRFSIISEQGNEEYSGSNTVLIGDRIAPQTTEIRNGTLMVNYTNRYFWESFSVNPSVGKSIFLIFEDGELKETLREVLSREIARALIIKERADYTSNCEELIVSVLDSRDSAWFVRVVCDGRL